MFGDARLEDRIREVELGDEAGNRGRAGAYRCRAQPTIKRTSARVKDDARHILDGAFMVIVVDARSQRGNPQDVSTIDAGIGLVNPLAGEREVGILRLGLLQDGRQAHRLDASFLRRGSFLLRRFDGFDRLGDRFGALSFLKAC